MLTLEVGADPSFGRTGELMLDGPRRRGFDRVYARLPGAAVFGQGGIAMGAATPEEMVTDWEKMINGGDIEAVLAFYEPEAVVVLPKDEGGPVKGHDAVRQVLEQFLALKPTFSITLRRATEAKDVALIIGDWSLRGTGPDGNAVTMEGRFRDVLHKQSDGSWLIAIDNPFGDE